MRSTTIAISVLGLLAAAVSGCGPAARALQSPDSSTTRPAQRAGAPSAPAVETTTRPAASEKSMKTETAMFGAGCFWGVEETFRQMPGVVSTAVGYSGGRTENPTYKDVCTDTTGHVEVVLVEFDPAKVTYEQVLEVFWKAHNPTQVNRQGPDIGAQYRSVVFCQTPEQEKVAAASKARLEASRKYSKPIATAIEPARKFYRAEEYHQQYLAKRGLSNCHVPSGD